MNRKTFVIAVLVCVGTLHAQSSQPVAAADAGSAIAALRGELIDSFNKGDLPRLLSHLDDDVVVTWQNGEVCRGPDEVKRYYDKMMTGPDRRVESVHADPKVKDRHVYGDWALSWGLMNDEFKLTDGSMLKLDSRFTATIARRGDVWKVTGFHASTNAFDNPILSYAMRRAATTAGLIAGVVGLTGGVVVGLMLRRRQRA